MDFFVDMQKPIECTSCHRKTMGRIVDDEYLDRTFFDLRMVIARDRATGQMVDTRVTLDVVAYACQECAHIDLAVLRPIASLQEAGKK